MNNGFNARRLINELKRLYCDVDFAIVHERAWHSTTFAGTRFCISTTLSPTDDSGFPDRLASHEFQLAGQLVADIAVTQDEEIDGMSRYRIEVLVLED